MIKNMLVFYIYLICKFVFLMNIIREIYRSESESLWKGVDICEK